jgi:hypothetical protein
MQAMKNAGEFCPPWKNLSTWINNQCWDMKVAKPAQSNKQQQTNYSLAT